MLILGMGKDEDMVYSLHRQATSPPSEMTKDKWLWWLKETRTTVSDHNQRGRDINNEKLRGKKTQKNAQIPFHIPHLVQ